MGALGADHGEPFTDESPTFLLRTDLGEASRAWTVRDERPTPVQTGSKSDGSYDPLLRVCGTQDDTDRRASARPGSGSRRTAAERFFSARSRRGDRKQRDHRTTQAGRSLRDQENDGIEGKCLTSSHLTGHRDDDRLEGMELSVSFHAAARLRERNISMSMVEAVVRFGTERRQGLSRVRYTVDEEAVRSAGAQEEDISTLEGMVASLPSLPAGHRFSRHSESPGRRADETVFSRLHGCSAQKGNGTAGRPLRSSLLSFLLPVSLSLSRSSPSRKGFQARSWDSRTYASFSPIRSFRRRHGTRSARGSFARASSCVRHTPSPHSSSGSGQEKRKRYSGCSFSFPSSSPGPQRRS